MTSHASARFRSLGPEKRAVVIEAAAAEFATHGFAAASTNRIAAAAGVSKGALFSYFPSKDELFAGVVETLVEEINAEVARLTENEHADLIETLRAAAVAGLAFHQRVPHLFAIYTEIVYRGSIPDRALHLARVSALSRGFYTTVVDRAIASGQLAPGLSRDAVVLLVDAALSRLQDLLVVAALRPDAAGREEPIDEATYQRLADGTIELLRRALLPR